MTKETKEKLVNPSVLAFERKLDPSDGVFSGGKWEDRSGGEKWASLRLNPKSIRGTISNRLKASKESDPAKLDANVAKPNLQTVDVCVLPEDADTLRVKFTLRILPGVGVPSACNNMDYKSRLEEVISSYQGQVGFSELARRYAYNLASGRFLWRNRFGAEAVEVTICRRKEGKTEASWTFNALELSLRDFDRKVAGLEEVSRCIEDGLSGKGFILLEVVAYSRIGEGQEVFPSQELILDKEKAGKSRTLYSVNDVAAMHSQKIGNAIRTVDTWYPEASSYGPISVEPYGSVTTVSRAFRQPKEKADFYTLLDRWLLKGDAPDVNSQHFVIANLIRGGVFGEAEKKD